MCGDSAMLMAADCFLLTQPFNYGTMFFQLGPYECSIETGAISDSLLGISFSLSPFFYFRTDNFMSVQKS